jgi:RsiW-degrading membrane proteinase PrsW (M82 family)
MKIAIVGMSSATLQGEFFTLQWCFKKIGLFCMIISKLFPCFSMLFQLMILSVSSTHSFSFLNKVKNKHIFSNASCLFGFLAHGLKVWVLN